jgi:hypothetical protein
MGGGEDMGGHVLRETTSRGLCGLVCRVFCFITAGPITVRVGYEKRFFCDPAGVRAK